jgi:hypothetical protein
LRCGLVREAQSRQGMRGILVAHGVTGSPLPPYSGVFQGFLGSAKRREPQAATS